MVQTFVVVQLLYLSCRKSYLRRVELLDISNPIVFWIASCRHGH
jgi:hypothetical protein